jgi:hypothetical protein
VPGQKTFRVYANFNTDLVEIDACFGTNQAPWSIYSTQPFYQNPVGALIGSAINPLFFAALPSLTYDSWIALGAGPGDDNSVLSVGTDLFFNDFANNGGNVMVDTEVGASLFYTPGASPAAFPQEGKVLLGQFTTAGIVSLSYNLQFRDPSQSTVQVTDLNITFPVMGQGCMDEAACNYDDEATEDDGSCTYPETYFDCSNSCLNDDDFDGICDEFEISGCMVSFACNYNSEATDDDGSCVFAVEFCEVCNSQGGVDYQDADGDGVCDSDEILGCPNPEACNYIEDATDFAECDFCSCSINNGGASSLAYSMTVEEFAFDGVPGMTTYRFYVNMLNSDDFLSAIFGNSDDPLFISTGGAGFYNDEAATGGAADGINPNLLVPPFNAFFPNLPFDSWYTVGIESAPTGTETVISSVESSSQAWREKFDAASPLSGQDIVMDDNSGGAWYILNGAPNGIPDETNKRVLFLQLTTAGTPEGTINLQVFQHGVGEADFRFTFNFEGPGTYFSEGANLNDCGCSDPSAWNYNPNAEYDGGICIPFINGCTDEDACNFDSEANTEDGSCDYLSCVVLGCTNPEACNFSPNANFENGSCVFAESGLDCDGNCLQDADEDGVCDDDEIVGCIDVTACNYNSAATDEGVACEYAVQPCATCSGETDGTGVVLSNDANGDGICDGEAIPGCTDSAACNFNEDATDDDGSCAFATQPCEECTSAGEVVLNDADGDGICDADEIEGCQDPDACNFSEEATDNDNSCNYANAANCEYCAEDGTVGLADADADGVCDTDEIPGCTELNACNYSPEATDNDGSCDFCSCYENDQTPYRLHIEEYAVNAVPGHTTYRLSVVMENEDDKLVQMFGNSLKPLILETDSGFFNDMAVTGGSVNGINPFYLQPPYSTFFPWMGFDSWYTIGIETTASSALGQMAVASIGPGLAVFDANSPLSGENVLLNSVSGSAWYAPSASTNGIPGEDGQVLVMQLTTAGDFSGQFNAAIRPHGLASQEFDLTFVFDGPGEFNYLTDFEPPACGCTEEEALNYDDSAEYDDGSCSFFGDLPEDWVVTPTPASGILLGNATLEALPIAVEDYVGAFTAAGFCAGLAQPTLDTDGTAYISLPIYGDDSTTPLEIEGMQAGQTFQLRLFDASADSVLVWTDGQGNPAITGWQNTNGAPIPGLDDPATNYNFLLEPIACDGTLDECGICNGPGAIYDCGCSDLPPADCDCEGNVLDALGECGGTCPADADGDGVCDDVDSCVGTVDACGVCNGPGAIYSCGCFEQPAEDCDCDGNQADVLGECGGTCEADEDGDGICDDVDPCVGTLDSCGVCNGPGAVYSCGCFEQPVGDCDCEGNVLDALGECGGECAEDLDGDGICDDVDDCVGAFDSCGVCNGPGAVYDCGCSPIPAGDCDCEGNVLDAVGVCGGDCEGDADGDGICDTDEVPGCDIAGACNFNCEATDNDGSCVWPEPGYDCNGECSVDADADGVCDFEEIVGCQDPLACNFDANATDPGYCYFAAPYYDCDGTCSVDLDGDGVCDELEIAGCTDFTACNFLIEATDEDGSCLYASSGYDCTGGCLIDSDSDGICDQDETTGCLDPEACNFDAFATDSGYCDYPAQGYDCQGACLIDSDGDGVCDEFEIAGCTDHTACNYLSSATDDDGSCDYPTSGYACDGSCLLDSDGDGVCDQNEVTGCQDSNACNYDSSSTDSGLCIYADSGYDCQGACLIDSDGDGICDDFEIGGCTDLEACNFELSATDDDGSCDYALAGYACDGSCLLDSDGDGVCDQNEVTGCQDSEACNYDSVATDSGLCIYANSGYDCNGLCLSDIDGDGICDEFEVIGCTDHTACNYSDEATDDDGSCDHAIAGFACDGSCLLDSDGDGVCDQNEVTGCQNPESCNYDSSATDSGYCDTPEPGYDCIGSCLSDIDGDGICDEFEIAGCTDLEACNFELSATDDDGSCEYATLGYACDGGCLLDSDGDGVCDQNEVTGCQDSEACNYDFDATDSGLCIYADSGYDCIGSCLSDIDGDGICDEFEIAGCTDLEACNFELSATDDDGSCEYATLGYACDGGCLLDSDGDGVCDQNEVTGCQDSEACNYESIATDSGLCIYADSGYDCAGSCLSDIDGDGICDGFEIAGCTDHTACNFDAAATDDNGGCVYAETGYGCDGSCLVDSDGDGVCEQDEIWGCQDETACNYNFEATEAGLCVYADSGYDCDGACLTDSDGDGVCDGEELWGCVEELAYNFNPYATEDDGSCVYSGPSECPTDFNGDGATGTADLLLFLSEFETTCE